MDVSRSGFWSKEVGYGEKSIRDWQEEAYEVAKEKGWHDKERTFGDIIALMHSELSEALEWWREHQSLAPMEEYNAIGGIPKPVGIPSEFADVMIRILDTCEYFDIDLETAVRTKMEYNRTRPYRHGGKAL
jgi:NTP pyrophosphatase (non-canonical NTP hydrolase)